MKAVILGPGRIGCGFVGHLLSLSGYDLVFAGRGAVVEQLARAGRYVVRLTDGRHSVDTTVGGIRAIDMADVTALAAEIADADLVAVSVGPQNLGSIAPLLAAGLVRRTSPVNVIAFENCTDPAGCLREAVLRCAPALRDAGHGFSGALVSRIVTRRIGDLSGSDPLVFLGDPPNDFVVHGPSLCGPVPRIAGLRAVEDFGAWVTKKLYMFSAGHAAAAYLGALKGYHYVHAAVRDPEIRKAVREAMEEGRRGLERRYGPELAGDRSDIEAILKRFDNAALADPVVRVGRDPLRKLGSEDRLVGAARLAAEAGVKPRRLALVAAAAMCFQCAADSGTVRIGGPEATLRTVSGLDPSRGIGKDVVNAFARLAAGREGDNVLLSLQELVWSGGRKPADGAQPALQSA